jgi:putative oxidoreductase
MKIGRLLLRLTVGGFFFGHGTQKLFGWFGGRGLEATAGNFEKLGLRPARRTALAAGAAEAGGGAALALGLATPVNASVLTATMLTAINRVHFKNPHCAVAKPPTRSREPRTCQCACASREAATRLRPPGTR